MKTQWWAILLVLTGTLAQADEKSVQLPEKEQVHLFLLIGQSNMAGRGKVAEQDLKPHPRVVTFNKAQQWVPAVDPLHFDKPNAVGVGLGKTFAEIVAEANPEVTIGLIPCAVGGSSILAWEPGAFDKATNTHPYDDMLVRCRAALKDGTLKGILWHQGESDCNATRAPMYEQKLHALLRRLHSELDAEKVPFILGQLSQFDGKEWNEHKQQVNAAHQNLAKHFPLIGFVTSEKLVHKGDNVHFDAASYREFGKRYAARYLELTKQQ